MPFAPYQSAMKWALSMNTISRRNHLGRRLMMKRISLILLSLVLFVTCLVPVSAQDRRHHSRFGRKARTAAIVGGGALVGAAIGHGRGAAIGAGAAGLYAMNRPAARHHFK